MTNITRYLRHHKEVSTCQDIARCGQEVLSWSDVDLEQKFLGIPDRQPQYRKDKRKGERREKRELSITITPPPTGRRTGKIFLSLDTLNSIVLVAIVESIAASERTAS